MRNIYLFSQMGSDHVTHFCWLHHCSQTLNKDLHPRPNPTYGSRVIICFFSWDQVMRTKGCHSYVVALGSLPLQCPPSLCVLNLPQIQVQLRFPMPVWLILQRRKGCTSAHHTCGPSLFMFLCRTFWFQLYFPDKTISLLSTNISYSSFIPLVWWGAWLTGSTEWMEIDLSWTFWNKLVQWD